jgi:hypothetical protein
MPCRRASYQPDAGPAIRSLPFGERRARTKKRRAGWLASLFDHAHWCGRIREEDGRCSETAFTAGATGSRAISLHSGKSAPMHENQIGLISRDRRQHRHAELRPASSSDPGSGLRAEPACAQPCGRGAQLRLFRGNAFPTAFQKRDVPSFRGRDLHAAISSSEPEVPGRHCCREREPAIVHPIDACACRGRMA